MHDPKRGSDAGNDNDKSDNDAHRHTQAVETLWPGRRGNRRSASAPGGCACAAVFQPPGTAVSSLSALRVAKTYSPEQNGAKRFARRYGDQLVCVRHRLNESGTIRHTTVELLIESTPVASRARSLVAIRIPATDKSTRTVLLACSAQWQAKERYWLLPRMVAKNLRLLRSAVPIKG